MSWWGAARRVANATGPGGNASGPTVQGSIPKESTPTGGEGSGGRELSGATCRDQAEAFVSWASRSGRGMGAFESWAGTKDFARGDKTLIRAMAARLLAPKADA